MYKGLRADSYSLACPVVALLSHGEGALDETKRLDLELGS